jgi:hypothetical protein
MSLRGRSCSALARPAKAGVPEAISNVMYEIASSGSAPPSNDIDNFQIFYWMNITRFRLQNNHSLLFISFDILVL